MNTDVNVIAAGFDYSLVLKRDGTVWGTGGNDKGQLGDGTWGTGNKRNTFGQAKDLSGQLGGVDAHTRDAGTACKS